LTRFEIVAHRGITGGAPENTLPAFLSAVELGADAIELDVRLTADRVPVVYHYYYLDQHTDAAGAVFDRTYEQLQAVRVRGESGIDGRGEKIPALTEVLAALGGRIGLEIEIKGPEPEAPAIIAEVLRRYPSIWETIEITSYEPALLLSVREHCPGLTVDLLYPRSEAWMKPDVVAYEAVQRARLARARAVHLHPSQLSEETVAAVRAHGIDIHAWEVNDLPALETALALGIPRICTDRFQQAWEFRRRIV